MYDEPRLLSEWAEKINVELTSNWDGSPCGTMVNERNNMLGSEF